MKFIDISFPITIISVRFTKKKAYLYIKTPKSYFTIETTRNSAKRILKENEINYYSK